MRGPAAEQIVGGDPTFRVALERHDGSRVTVEGAELLSGEEAGARAHALRSTVNKSEWAAICVVNERTGIARDRISWAKPGHVLIGCPDCGVVEVKPDGFERGRAVCGPCPICGESLFFA